MGLPDPDLGDVVAAGVQSALIETWCHMPGQIQSYDNTTQLADVKPLFRPTIIDYEGNELTYDLDVIRDVPIEFPGCGDWFISWPIAKGDSVKLCFHDRSLEDWLQNGGIVDVTDIRMHHLTDASAWPGLRAKPNNLGSDVSATNMVLGKKGGPQIQISEALVLLGSGSASAFVALANLVNSELNTIATIINSAVCASPGSKLVFAPPYAAGYVPNDVSATKVKAT